jgi:beta-galactosidase
LNIVGDVIVPRLLTLAFAFIASLLWTAAPGLAETRSLSQGWSFHLGESKGAEAPAFDDSSWHKVVVPHDWSIMDKPDGSPPFDPRAIAGQDSGYLPGGIGWYRRHLSLTPAEAGKVLLLNFEAIYMDADVWVNGKHLTRHHYGYTAFSIDLTGKVHPGVNVITVRAHHADPSSRWYAGSGIIRPVALEILDRVHIDPNSVTVMTPVATAERAVISMKASVDNRSANAQTVELVSRILSPQGTTIAEARQNHSIAPGGRFEASPGLEISRPLLWSPDTPNLYTLVQQARVGGTITDERRTRFGIRTVTFDARHGLRINGEPMKMRGGDIHHDNYMIGAAGVADADRRKVELMKAAGYNAVRNAHNPASQATLDAADELGMLVIDEAFDAWNKSKRAEDYSRFFQADWEQDLESLIVSGRNHPSVVLWSIGNEIPETGTKLGVETAKTLAARLHALDPARPVTQAINNDQPLSTNQAAVLDVPAFNYHAELFTKEHERLPDKPMYTAESLPKDAFQYWREVETKPWVVGDFVWTAFDYLGESGIGWMGYSQDWQKLGPYPWHLAYCGEIDATGRKRPAAYYREIVWKTGIDPISAFVRQPNGTEDLPDRHLFPITPPHLDWSHDEVHPSWTWPGHEGEPLEVVVYSEFPEVELFLNGKTLGRKAVGLTSEYKASYKVPYSPGQITAIGYRNGREAGRWSLQTAGAPVSAKVSTERTQIAANGEDLAYVTVELVDANGAPVYAQSGDRGVRVTVSGAGTLAGIGNGDPRDASSFNSGRRKTFHGRVVAAVRAGTGAGTIVVEIEPDGLPMRRVEINAVSD